MDYNTCRPRLIIPEYGRMVQNMIDYACTLPDKATRQRCAEAIVNVMASFFPQRRMQTDFWHKLWDHLALMADYKLDIDYPFEVVRRSGKQQPPRIPYPQTRIKYRHYGHLLEELAGKLKDMPEGEERNQLAALVAGRMRRSLNDWNKDALDDAKIAADLADYTHGAIRFTPEDMPVAAGQDNRRAGGRVRRYRRSY